MQFRIGAGNGAGVKPFWLTTPPTGTTKVLNIHLKFLSTLPVRGATGSGDTKSNGESDISIHAPREGSDSPILLQALKKDISIHAPREGSDCKIEQ